MVGFRGRLERAVYEGHRAVIEAIVLCAGLATRLKPLSDYVPKCLVRVSGKPILGHILDQLTKAGITQIAINIHTFPSEVVSYATKNYPNLVFTFFYEPKPVGRERTLINVNPHLSNPYFVINGDTVTNIDLVEMRKHLGKLHRLVFSKDSLEHHGGVELIQNGWVGEEIYNPEGSWYYDCGTLEKLEKAERELSGRFS